MLQPISLAATGLFEYCHDIMDSFTLYHSTNKNLFQSDFQLKSYFPPYEQCQILLIAEIYHIFPPPHRLQKEFLTNLEEKN